MEHKKQEQQPESDSTLTSVGDCTGRGGELCDYCRILDDEAEEEYQAIYGDVQAEARRRRWNDMQAGRHGKRWRMERERERARAAALRAPTPLDRSQLLPPAG